MSQVATVEYKNTIHAYMEWCQRNGLNRNRYESLQAYIDYLNKGS